MAKPKEFVGINFPMNMRQVSFGSQDNAQRQDAAERDEEESESNSGSAADEIDSRDRSPRVASKTTPKGRKNRHDREEDVIAKLSPSQKEAIVKEYLRQQNEKTDQTRGRSSQTRSEDRLKEDHALGPRKHGTAGTHRRRRDKAMNDASMETTDEDKEQPVHEPYPLRQYPSHLVYRVSRQAHTGRPSTAPHPGNFMVPTTTTAQDTALKYGGSSYLEPGGAYQYKDQAAAWRDRRAEYDETRHVDGFGTSYQGQQAAVAGQNEQHVTVEDVSDSASEEGVEPAAASRAGTLSGSRNRGFGPSVPARNSPRSLNGFGAQTSSTLYPTLRRLSLTEPQQEKSARDLHLHSRSHDNAYASSAVGSKHYNPNDTALAASPQRPSQNIMETRSMGSTYYSYTHRPTMKQTLPDMNRFPTESVEDYTLPAGHAQHEENLAARRASHPKAEITDEEAELRRILRK